MNDVNILLWKNKQDKDRLKKRKEKITKVIFEKRKKQFEEDFDNNQQLTKNQKKFYNDLFKGDKEIKQKKTKKNLETETKVESKKKTFKKLNEEEKNKLKTEKLEKRKLISKNLKKKTKKGQPLMKYRLQKLTSTILSKK